MKIEQEIGKKTWLVDVEEIKIRKGKVTDSFMSRTAVAIDMDQKVPIYY